MPRYRVRKNWGHSWKEKANLSIHFLKGVDRERKKEPLVTLCILKIRGPCDQL